MKIYDQLGSLFWLLMAVYVCMESVRLGLGTLRNPGMGFMTFGASVLLGVFSLIVFLQTSLKKEERAKAQAPSTGGLWVRVFFVTAGLLIYSQAMPVLGYLFSNTTSKKEKTELVILITPHVVNSIDEAEYTSREFKEKLGQVKKLIKKNDWDFYTMPERSTPRSWCPCFKPRPIRWGSRWWNPPMPV